MEGNQGDSARTKGGGGTQRGANISKSRFYLMFYVIHIT